MRSLAILGLVMLACKPVVPETSTDGPSDTSIASNNTTASLPTTSWSTSGSSDAPEGTSGSASTVEVSSTNSSGDIETSTNDASSSTAGGDFGGAHRLCAGLATFKVNDGEWLELASPDDKVALTGIECLDGDLALFPGIGDATGLGALRVITGNLLATGNEPISPLAIFEGLDNLERIGGNLELFEAPVPTFTGLESLHTIDGDLSTKFTNLQDVHGLEGLQTVGGSLLLGNCDWNANSEEKDSSQVPSLAGLENLTTIGGHLDVASNKIVDVAVPGLEAVGWFRVCNATSLMSVTLPSLTEAGAVQFSHYTAYPQLSMLDLPKLEIIQEHLAIRGTQIVDLAGLAALKSVGTTLSLLDNKQLPTCIAKAFASEIAVGGDLEIAGNLLDKCGG